MHELELSATTVELQQLLLKVGCSIPVENLELTVSRATYAAELIYMLEARLMASEPKTVTKSIDVPATWWDAFKCHFARRWWLRRYCASHPVQYRTVTLVAKVSAVYPTLPLIPRHRSRFHVDRQIHPKFWSCD